MGDVDVVSMAVVGVHSVRVRWGSLLYSRWVLHQPASLDLHPLQDLMLVKPLHRVGAKHGQVVRQGLVIGSQVLGQGSIGALEVVRRQRRGRGRGHGMARAVGGQLGVREGKYGVRDDVIALWWGLRRGRGVTVRMRA